MRMHITLGIVAIELYVGVDICNYMLFHNKVVCIFSPHAQHCASIQSHGQNNGQRTRNY